jgi:hypothetical protein
MINEIDLEGIPEDTSAVECYCCPAELSTWTDEEGKRYYCRVENLLEDLFHVGAMREGSLFSWTIPYLDGTWHRHYAIWLGNNMMQQIKVEKICSRDVENLEEQEMLIREFPNNYGLPYEMPMSFLMNVGFLRSLR